MLKAFAIESKRTGRISCKCCGISYTHREYGILKEAKKIMYVRYKRKSYCLTCLPKVAAETREKEVKLITLEGKTKTIKFYYP